MSILHINQIKNKMSENFFDSLDKDDLNLQDQEYEVKLLTRSLAAYAVYSTVDCTILDASKSVVDGAEDNGIDAIFYSENDKKLVIVQSKWSIKGKSEPSSSDVQKFCTGVKDLFNAEFDRFNDKIRSKQQQIEKALNEFDTIYELVLIDTNETKELAKHANRHIKDLISEMNNTGDDASKNIVTYRRMHQGRIFESLAATSSNEPISIELGLAQWGLITEPYKAYFGITSGDEVASWYDDYGNFLFEKNIRKVLGHTDVNDEIKGTLENNKKDFWYFNNGITIICEGIEKSLLGGSSRDYGSFKLTNLSIVNGAQTVSTIGNFKKNFPDDSLEDVKIQVRVISLESTPEFFGKKVTRTNNRQNRIENRDFVSQDPEQQRIKTELSIENIEYSIARSDSFTKDENTFDVIEGLLAIIASKNKTSLSVQSKSGIGKFFEDLNKGIYKEVFNRNTQGVFVFNCVQLNRVIDLSLSDHIRSLPKKSGRKYGTLVHGNRLIFQLVFAQLYSNQNELSSLEFEVDKDAVSEEVDTILGLMEEKLEELYPENFLATIFKNTSKCNTLVDAIKDAL